MASPLAILVTILALVCPSLAVVPINTSAIKDDLTLDFYESKCPNVEDIIMDVMRRITQKNPGWIPAILRMYFHDCFISGCDGSILLKPARYNGFASELAHPNNNLRGVEAIDEIKAELEKQCPNVVSCADILAYAARDASVLAGNSYFKIPAGRRDGGFVDGNLPEDLPGGNFKTEDLIRIYAERGLTVEDMVILEGAHSIGESKCLVTIANDRFVANVTGAAEIINKKFKAKVMNKYCPKAKQSDWAKIASPMNPKKLDSAWGVTFFKNIIKGKAVIPADLGFAVYPGTKDLVHKYAHDSDLWMKKFGEAIIKVSKINVLTGEQGEIRRHCSVLNHVDMTA